MKHFVFTAIAFCVLAAITANAQAQTGAGKILVVYFTMPELPAGRASASEGSPPETGGVDALAGASRIVVGGRVSGNVEFVANCIQSGGR